MLAALILSGCGGSSHSKASPAWQTVRSASFRFQAPPTWSVARGPHGTKAWSGRDLVEVATFPLAHPYTTALFARVQTELATRMAAVAKQTGGSVTGHRIVTAGGIRSHSYDVRVGGRVDHYTFVLRGQREYQLLCSADTAVCNRLLVSFAVA